MIELKNLVKTYQMGDEIVRALDGVNLRIEQGEFVAIMGPSGSGKSTMMHVLGLLDVPDSGSYRLMDQEVSSLDETALTFLRQQVIGFVFQQFHLLPRTTALQNVALPHLYSRSKADYSQAAYWLKKVGLGNRLDHKPNELSGGQQQRVAIARALANNAKILFADEPTGNLDSQSEKEIMALLKELNEEGITVILVTHEESIAQHTRRVIRMRDGKIEQDERTGERLTPTIPLKEFSNTSRKSSALQNTLVYFQQGVRALVANKSRSLLSTLGILIGVGSVIAMVALGRGAKEAVKAQMARMGSNRLQLNPGAVKIGGASTGVGGSTRLTLEDGDAIWRNFPQVRRVAPEVDGRGQVTYENKNWNTKIRGTTPDYAPMHDLNPEIGRFFTEEENAQRKRVVVLGLTVSKNLFGEKDPLGEWIKINKVPFQVVGLLPERGDSGGNDRDDTLVIPVVTAMRRVLGKTYVDEYNLEVKEADQIKPIQDELKEFMIKRHHVALSQNEPFQVRDLAEIQNAVLESSNTMSIMIVCVAAISLMVGGIGIMNIMLVTVKERTREIGLRKAIGAGRKDILTQFLAEAIVLTLTGGFLGVLLAWGITYAMTVFAGWNVIFSADAVILATGLSVGIGVLFGFWPAAQASKLDPIKALRAE